MKIKLHIIGACIFCVVGFGCNNKSSTKTLSNIFCDCGKPIVEWKSALTGNPSKLQEEPIIRKKVEDCLAPYKSNFTKFKNDTLFQEEVKQDVNHICPEVSGSVPALFKILFQ